MGGEARDGWRCEDGEEGAIGGMEGGVAARPEPAEGELVGITVAGPPDAGIAAGEVADVSEAAGTVAEEAGAAGVLAGGGIPAGVIVTGRGGGAGREVVVRGAEAAGGAGGMGTATPCTASVGGKISIGVEVAAGVEAAATAFSANVPSETDATGSSAVPWPAALGGAPASVEGEEAGGGGATPRRAARMVASWRAMRASSSLSAAQASCAP